MGSSGDDVAGIGIKDNYVCIGALGNDALLWIYPESLSNGGADYLHKSGGTQHTCTNSKMQSKCTSHTLNYNTELHRVKPEGRSSTSSNEIQ